MKIRLKIRQILCGALLLGLAASCAPSASADLEAGFKNPPADIQTSVYWYWVSGYISEEGVVKDLQAMKRAGINRAFIGCIGESSVQAPYPQVAFGSEEWWRILHTALKTATELGIEIGIFNTPGWSQSGGPWIKPEQAMRYLTSVHREVTGGQHVELLLEKPSADFQDVKVLAFPAGEALPALSSGPVSFPASSKRPYAVDFTAPEGFTLRTVKVTPSHDGILANARLLADNGDGYQPVTEFGIARINSALIVGFDPYAPIVVTVADTPARRFRLEFGDAVAGKTLENIELLSAPLLESYPEKTLAKMFQAPLPYWHEYQWREQPPLSDASQAIPAAQVTDISDCLQGDTLRWDAPAGRWIVMRTGMRPTGVTNAPADPEATGLEVDKMSREHVRAHFDAFMGEICRRIPEADRKSWKVVVQDSYETGGQNFTDDFLDSFKQRYGYDPLPFLPVYEGYVVESRDRSDRFLWDMRRLVADRVAYDYVGGLRDVCHEHGLHTWLENYGHWGFPAEFLQYGGQSDEIGGEFWSFGDLGNIENRAASSCGHIYGKTRISAESFTSGGRPFECYPAQMKTRGDRFFAEGINNTLLHLYISQPSDERVPGVNAWFGSEFNRMNTWFTQMDLFTTYLKRVNYMLQQGLNVADVAYFIGEDTPKMTGLAEPALPEGYQFDYINAEVILRDLNMEDGLLTLPHGTKYRLLVLPPLKTMHPELLEKLATLLRNGAVVLGTPPDRSPSGQDYPNTDKRVQSLSAELWKGWDGQTKTAIPVGKGFLLCGMDMHEALDFIHCAPDCALPQGAPVVYGHRTLPGAEVYFLANQSGEAVDVSPVFRVNGRQPELWNPMDGSIRPLPSYAEKEDNCTEVPLRFCPGESAFIVFRKPSEATGGEASIDINFPRPHTLVQLDGDWGIHFRDSLRAPAPATLTSQLFDLTTSSNDTIRYYSGTIDYETTFELPQKPAGRLYLNLNHVGVMAKVKVNGQYAGGVWTAPYHVEVTDLAVAGKNRVEVEVVTTWQNRLIGDSRLPEQERTTWAARNTWTPQDALQPSGLMGPVTLEEVK